MKSNAKDEDYPNSFADVKSVLGDNLKQYRKRAELSQEELGHKIDADQAYISRLEAGQLNPTLETISELANALGVTVENLFSFSYRDME